MNMNGMNERAEYEISFFSQSAFVTFLRQDELVPRGKVGEPAKTSLPMTSRNRVKRRTNHGTASVPGTKPKRE